MPRRDARAAPLALLAVLSVIGAGCVGAAPPASPPAPSATAVLTPSSEGPPPPALPSAGAPSPTATPAAASPSPAPAGASGGTAIARAEDIPPGTSRRFEVGGRDVVVANLGGKLVAYLATCPVHAQYLVMRQGQGFVCPHGTFAADGRGDSGVPLEVGASLVRVPLRVEGGMVYAG